VVASYTRTGNIGGILARTTASSSTFYAYDLGGNVTTLTDNSGTQVGSYTYDAWGNTVASSGARAAENPYRFSTKENIAGFYSYGLRFYAPGLGRWINRDPSSEAGGINLYAFLRGNPINYWDEYGLTYWDYNFTYVSPMVLGISCGVQKQSTGSFWTGWHPYVGPAVGTPGASGMATWSPGNVATGGLVGISANSGVGLAGNFGFSYGPPPSGFWELGIGVGSPSINGSWTYVY